VAIGLAVVALILGAANRVQQPRYGYTDVGQLVAGYGPAAQVDEQIEAELAPMRQKLEEQRLATDAVRAKAEAQTDQLSAQDLAVLNLQLLTARQRQDDLDGQLRAVETRLRKERMAPIYLSLNQQMRLFGAANGYAIIWTATTAGNLAYASDAANVTDDLLDWMSTHPATE
jgi:Skp family chaperone for outer membrane proteins